MWVLNFFVLYQIDHREEKILIEEHRVFLRDLMDHQFHQLFQTRILKNIINFGTKELKIFVIKLCTSLTEVKNCDS